MNVETSMLWFDRIFPPFMFLVMPLIYTIIPSKPSNNADAAKARQLQQLLWRVAFGPALVKHVLLEAEPMDPDNSPVLQTAYEKHCRARSWVINCAANQS